MQQSSCQRAVYGFAYHKQKHAQLAREVSEIERLRIDRDYWRDRAIELERLLNIVEEMDV